MKLPFAATILLAVGSTILAADPYAGYIYPAGIQAGTTNRFIIGGQNMWGNQCMYFDNPGLHVLKIEKVPGFSPPTRLQQKHLKNWLDGIAAGHREEPPKPDDPHLDEWRSNVWWRALNTLDAGQLAIVEHDLYTPRNALQSTPSLRQMMLVTVAADANAEPGWCLFSLWSWGGISAPRPFEISTLPRVPEPLYVPPHRPQPEPRFVDLRTGGTVLDGQIMPGSTDAFRLKLAAGTRYTFKVTARELQPYIGDAVPGFFNAVVTLKDEDGKVVATADDEARFHPDPMLTFTPSHDGDHLLEIHDVLYRGRADFVYSITINANETQQQKPLFAATPYPMGGAEAPNLSSSPDGVVAQPGAVSTKTFTIDRPGPHILEVTARRNGSPLDAVLTLRKKPGAPPLAQWDDVTNTVFSGTIPQEESDPIGIYDFKDSGDYVAEITDRTGHGGDAYVWWLDVRRPTPSFEVRSARSTLPLKGGTPLKVDFHILRKDGFKGNVTIEFPENIRAKNTVATSGVDIVTAELSFKGRRQEPVQPIKLFAKATIDDRMVRMPVIPCDEYEQAFAWRHLVPARTFLFRGLPGGGANQNKGQNGKKDKNKANDSKTTRRPSRTK